MKNSKIFIGMLAIAGSIFFTSCEKDEDEPSSTVSTVDTDMASRVLFAEEDVDGGADYEGQGNHQPMGEGHCHRNPELRAQFFQSLTEEERTQLGTYKPTLRMVRMKKRAFIHRLGRIRVMQLRNGETPQEQRETIRSNFESTLTPLEIEALAYMRSLREEFEANTTVSSN